MDAFSDAHSGGTSEQEGIAVYIVGTAEFLLQALIIFWGKRSGKVLREPREIFVEDQPGLQRMTRRGQVAEQAAENDQIDSARGRGQRRILFAQAAEPAEQMGIAAQLGDLEHLRKIGLQITEKAPRGDSIALYRFRSQGSCESLNAGIQDFREDRMG